MANTNLPPSNCQRPTADSQSPTPQHEGTTMVDLMHMVARSQSLKPSDSVESQPEPQHSNLQLFSQAYESLSFKQQDRFLQYFLGALSIVVSKEHWIRALKTAEQITSTGKNPSSND